MIKVHQSQSPRDLERAECVKIMLPLIEIRDRSTIPEWKQQVQGQFRLF